MEGVVRKAEAILVDWILDLYSEASPSQGRSGRPYIRAGCARYHRLPFFHQYQSSTCTENKARMSYISKRLVFQVFDDYP